MYGTLFERVIKYLLCQQMASVAGVGKENEIISVAFPTEDSVLSPLYLNLPNCGS